MCSHVFTCKTIKTLDTFLCIFFPDGATCGGLHAPLGHGLLLQRQLCPARDQRPWHPVQGWRGVEVLHLFYKLVLNPLELSTIPGGPGLHLRGREQLGKGLEMDTEPLTLYSFGHLLGFLGKFF